MTLNVQQAARGLLAEMHKTGTITPRMVKKYNPKLTDAQAKQVVKSLQDGFVSYGERDTLIGMGDGKPFVTGFARSLFSFTKLHTITNAEKKVCGRAMGMVARYGRIDRSILEQDFSLNPRAAAALAEAINNDGRITGQEANNLGRFGMRVYALARHIRDGAIKLRQVSRFLRSAYVYRGAPRMHHRVSAQKASFRHFARLSPLYTQQEAMDNLRDLQRAGVDVYPIVDDFFYKNGVISSASVRKLAHPYARDVLKRLPLKERMALAKKFLKNALMASPGNNTLIEYREILVSLTGKNSAFVKNFDARMFALKMQGKITTSHYQRITGQD